MGGAPPLPVEAVLKSVGWWRWRRALWGRCVCGICVELPCSFSLSDVICTSPAFPTEPSNKMNPSPNEKQIIQIQTPRIVLICSVLTWQPARCGCLRASRPPAAAPLPRSVGSGLRSRSRPPHQGVEAAGGQRVPVLASAVAGGCAGPIVLGGGCAGLPAPAVCCSPAPAARHHVCTVSVAAGGGCVPTAWVGGGDCAGSAGGGDGSRPAAASTSRRGGEAAGGPIGGEGSAALERVRSWSCTAEAGAWAGAGALGGGCGRGG